MFRRLDNSLEVLLVHPGGPFFQRKNAGAWTIPKGEVVGGESLLDRALIEFEEELGVPASGTFIELGSIKQKGGKIVHAWAMEGELPHDFKLVSNSFTIEWPPRSSAMREFPEVDRAEFFPIAIAKQKINPAQVTFLDRLSELLAQRD
jgi:predicted NUDIX family NTP pyrophosphohydrolase